MWTFLTPFICPSRSVAHRIPTAKILTAEVHQAKRSVCILCFFLFIIAFSVMLSSTAVCDEEKEQNNSDEAWIRGKVIWPGHDLTKASVDVFRDMKFKDLYTKGLLLKPEGIYALTIDDPGTYYIVAFVDDNDNNLFDAGDGMGMYGVMDWTDSRQKPSPVQVESGMKLTGIDIQITAVVDDQGRMSPISRPKSTEVITGVSGKVIWLNHKFSNTIVFVYSDPSWNNRIAQTEVRETGEYEIRLPVGRYYLLAVIDQNDTNLLDVGDRFGIWGMTKFDMFPKAVEVNEGHITKDRNILIIGQIGLSGRPMPLQEASGTVEKSVSLEGKISLSGNVIWPGREFMFGMVQAYNDPSMTIAAAQAKTDSKGKFWLLVPAGDYYIIAGVDADGDGKYTTGDGVGAYGVANAADQMPKKLTVAEGSQEKEINLVITAEFNDSGQLRPIQTSPDIFDELIVDASDSVSLEEDTSPTGISGKIIWEGREISKIMLIFSQNSRFEDGIRTSLQLDEDGSYECLVPPGNYYIMAIMDPNDNDQMDSGDGIGFYGAGYWGTPQKITVSEEWMTPLINIKVTALLGADGKITPVQTPGVIRFRYGEPDDILSKSTDDRAIQEWWYWDKGVTFTFEETDAGLILTNTHDFTPTEAQEEETTDQTHTEEEKSNGTFYYTFDRNIWAVDVDGTNRRWIAPGTQPTATSDGKKLLFLDTSGDIYLVEPGSEKSAQLVLNRREAGLQPTISHNGKIAAYTQDSGSYRSMILRNLETGEESPIPVGEMDLYNPAWSPDDELIAYSASPLSSSDQRNLNRDIYYYDIVAGRTERVSMSSQDEFDPTWSPTDERVLIYCRAEGNHSQLWITNFDADGKPVERQLTKYGGRNPAWSPSGEKIIYENNAQLWTIKPDGSEEVPIVVDGEPIFGLDPFWTR